MSSHNTWSRRGVLGAGLGLAAAPLVGMPAFAKDRHPAHITDCHVHVWLGGGKKKPSKTHRQEPFSYEELLKEMDGAGVQRATIVTPSWNPTGNKYPLEAANEHPDRFRVMGLFNTFAKPDPQAVANWMNQKGMAGMRLFLGAGPARTWFTSGQGDWLWPILEKNNIPVMLFVGGMMPTMAKIAEKHPHLKIALGNLGLPAGKVGTKAFDDYDTVLAMAKYPNISMKAESVPFLSQEPYPYKNVQPILRRVYDAFGPERMFWGSDLTLLMPRHIPYKDCVRCFTEEMTWMPDKDLDLVMGGAISKWLNWPV